MANPTVRRLRWDPARGRLVIGGIRYVLVRPETLVGAQKAVEGVLGERAGPALAAGGVAGGGASARRYREAIGRGGEDLVRRFCRTGGQIGWGRLEPVSLDEPQGRLVVEVEGSPFAEAYGRSSRPVCHLLRGVLAGLGRTVFGAEAETEETACAARGDPRCRFEVTRLEGGRKE